MCSWGPPGGHGGPKQPLSSLMPWAGPGVCDGFVDWLLDDVRVHVSEENKGRRVPAANINHGCDVFGMCLKYAIKFDTIKAMRDYFFNKNCCLSDTRSYWLLGVQYRTGKKRTVQPTTHGSVLHVTAFFWIYGNFGIFFFFLIQPNTHRAVLLT